MKVFSFLQRYRFSVGIIIFSLVLSSAFLVKIKKSDGFIGILGSFGGPVVSVTICTCPAPIMYLYVMIGPPSGGAYLVDPMTAQPYEYYNLWGATGSFTPYPTWKPMPTGPWMLGGYYESADICQITSGTTCVPLPPAMGVVTSYGTSLGPAI